MVIGVLVLLFILSKLFGGNGAAAVVTTTQAQIGDLQQMIDTSGTVKTEESKVYFSNVDVKVGEVKAQAGDAVKAGDVLLTYDANDLAAAKERAELKKQSTEGRIWKYWISRLQIPKPISRIWKLRFLKRRVILPMRGPCCRSV